MNYTVHTRTHRGGKGESERVERQYVQADIRMVVVVV